MDLLNRMHTFNDQKQTVEGFIISSNDLQYGNSQTIVSSLQYSASDIKFVRNFIYYFQNGNGVVRKYSKSGSLIWSIYPKIFVELSICVEVDSEDNVFILFNSEIKKNLPYANYTSLPGEDDRNYSVFIEKYNSQGNFLWGCPLDNGGWNNYYASKQSIAFYSDKVVVISDGGLKVFNNATGALERSDNTIFKHIATDSASNYYLTKTKLNSSSTKWISVLVKLDSSFSQKWEIEFSELISGISIVNDVIFILYTKRIPNTNNDVPYLVKYNTSGSLITPEYKFNTSFYNYSMFFTIDANENIYLSGNSGNGYSSNSFGTRKFNNEGKYITTLISSNDSGSSNNQIKHATSPNGVVYVAFYNDASKLSNRFEILMFDYNYFKIIQTFHNDYYKKIINNINYNLLSTTSKTVLSYYTIDQNNNVMSTTTIWDNLSNKESILTVGEDAYINVATTLINAYKTIYESATSEISGFTLTNTAAVTAGTAAIPDIPTYIVAQAQITTFSTYFGALVQRLQSDYESIKSKYNTTKGLVPTTLTIPASLLLIPATDDGYVYSTTAPFQVTTSKTEPTKQDQLLEIYKKYKTAEEGLRAFLNAQKFKTTYQNARRFISDSELSTSTVTTRSKIYQNQSITNTEYLDARRDVLMTLVNKYWALNPSASSTLPSFAPAPAPSSHQITTTTSETTLDTLESTYLTRTTPTPLWSDLISKLRSGIVSYLDTYKFLRTSSNVISGTAFISDSIITTDTTTVNATPATSVGSTGVIQYTKNGITKDSEYKILADIYNTYASAIATILSKVRDEAETALDAYTTARDTTLATCAFTIQELDNTTDSITISTSTSISEINSLKDRYITALINLYNTVRTDQIAFIGGYIKLYNTYNRFSTDTNITKYSNALAVIPSTILTGTDDQSTLTNLPVLTTTATTVPTASQLETLQNFCNSYKSVTGHHANLVSHIRTNLITFVEAFDRVWNSLPADVRANYSYTSPTITDATTDVMLYAYMNGYAGYTPDALYPATTTTTAPPPTVSYTQTYTTASSQGDVLARAIDFGTMYIYLETLLEMDAAQYSPINTFATTLTGYLSNVSQNLTQIVALESSIDTYMINMMILAQTNLNNLLQEYNALKSHITTFRQAFSNVLELPLIQEITFSQDSTDQQGFAYTPPPTGTYTQNNTYGSNSLYGTLQNFDTFSNNVYTFAEQLQPKLAEVQTTVQRFVGSLGTALGVSTISIFSSFSDTYSETLEKSKNTRDIITTASNTLVVHFMKTYLEDFYAGRRYLPTTEISTAMTNYLETCRKYLTDSDTLKISPFVYQDSDGSVSVMNVANTAFTEFTTKLVNNYQTKYQTWVTGSRIQTPSSTTILPTTVDADAFAPTAEVRSRYLTNWQSLMTDIQSATRTLLQNTKKLQTLSAKF